MTINSESDTVHRPVRSRAEVFDAAEMREFLDTAYGVRLRLREKRRRSGPLKHARTDIGPVTFDEVSLPGELAASPDPLNKVVAVWTDEGRVSGQCGGLTGAAAPGEVTLLSQPDLPYFVQSEDAHTTTVLMDPSLVAGVAGGRAGPATRAGPFLELPSRRLRSGPAVERHRRVREELRAGPGRHCHATGSRALQSPAGSRHHRDLPEHDGARPAPYDRTDSGPALLRRAIAYMEANAANDIALADIATAVHVTPRAVQYMFRRHLDTTPLQYLRRMRLDYAHRDLLTAERPDQTVTQIAARWGFMHTGRFAVLYRQTYGQSPHETLRG